MSMNSPAKDRLPRTSFLLRPRQMIREGYPQPGQHSGYVPTNESYEPVSDSSPLFSLHCELVYDQAGNIEIVWVVIVDEYLKVSQEIFVRPNETYVELIKTYRKPNLK